MFAFFKIDEVQNLFLVVVAEMYARLRLLTEHLLVFVFIAFSNTRTIVCHVKTNPLYSDAPGCIYCDVQRHVMLCCIRNKKKNEEQ